MWHKPIDPNLNQFTNSCKLLANSNALCRIEGEVPMRARASDLGVGLMDSLTPGLTRRPSHAWTGCHRAFAFGVFVRLSLIVLHTLHSYIHQTRPIRIYICAIYEGVINLISLSSTSQRMSLGLCVCPAGHQFLCRLAI